MKNLYRPYRCFGLVCILGLVACAPSVPLSRQGVPAVTADMQTDPVAGQEDAADDPALWVHPTDASRSLIVGTDKNRGVGGLYAYGLDGKIRFSVTDPALNNVDIRQGVELAGYRFDLAGATRRTDSTLSLYAVDSSAFRRIEGIPVRLDDPYGFCLGRDRNAGKVYAFNVGKNGIVTQFELQADSLGLLSGKMVKRYRFASQGEGCVADDDRGILWVGEEDRGLWKFRFHDPLDSTGVLVDSVAGGHLQDDVEGIALYVPEKGAGYVIVSSQGDNSFAVYDRESPHAYRGSFIVHASDTMGIGAVEETDGIEVVAAPLGERYPEGAFIAQDGHNRPANQNFKLVDWRKIRDALGL